MSGSAPHRLVLAFHSEASEDLSLACKAGGWSCCQGGAGRMPVFFFFFSNKLQMFLTTSMNILHDKIEVQVLSIIRLFLVK